MAFEIERRARFDNATYDRLIAYLSVNADDLGADDKTLQFYLYEDRLLKVVDNHSKGTAAIALKMTRIGQGTVYKELPQLPIASVDVPVAIMMMNTLGGFESTHSAFNKRHNYLVMGVEIAVKWSEAWGHHAEFEIVLPDTAPASEHVAGDLLIQNVADELGIKLMTREDEADFDKAFRLNQPNK